MTEISKARSTDVDRIKEIEIASALSPWSREDYLLEMERADSLFWVAKIEQKTVGFILARLIMYQNSNLNSNLKNGEIEIYNIAVLSKYRRQSIASELLRGVIEAGSRKCVREILLEVRKSNLTAQSFYANHGFKIIGERRSFYTNPVEDAFIMSLGIKSI